jgi:hypothetical protein
MHFLIPVTVPLFAAALLLSGFQVYSVAVVTAAQKEHSAHSKKKPTMFHYVCPMHEDVTSKKRGLCPKCKMKLVKKPIVTEPTTSSN